MRHPNFDPEYERIVRALRTVAALMVRSDEDKVTYEPIFMRLQREKKARDERQPTLDDMLAESLNQL